MYYFKADVINNPFYCQFHKVNTIFSIVSGRPKIMTPLATRAYIANIKSIVHIIAQENKNFDTFYLIMLEMKLNYLRLNCDLTKNEIPSTLDQV